MKLRELNIEKNNILRESIPVEIKNMVNVEILTNNLKFQIPKNNPHGGIHKLLTDYLNNECKSRIVLKTDAAKSFEACAEAIVNYQKKIKLSGTISPINTVFTGEAIALAIELNKNIKKKEEFFIFIYRQLVCAKCYKEHTN